MSAGSLKGSVGIVTLPGNFNYGNRLQALASAASDRSLGYGADVRARTPAGETCLHVLVRSQAEPRDPSLRGNLLGLLLMAGFQLYVMGTSIPSCIMIVASEGNSIVVSSSRDAADAVSVKKPGAVTILEDGNLS